MNEKYFKKKSILQTFQNSDTLKDVFEIDLRCIPYFWRILYFLILVDALDWFMSPHLKYLLQFDGLFPTSEAANVGYTTFSIFYVLGNNFFQYTLLLVLILLSSYGMICIMPPHWIRIIIFVLLVSLHSRVMPAITPGDIWIRNLLLFAVPLINVYKDLTTFPASSFQSPSTKKTKFCYCGVETVLYITMLISAHVIFASGISGFYYSLDPYQKVSQLLSLPYTFTTDFGYALSQHTTIVKFLLLSTSFLFWVGDGLLIVLILVVPRERRLGLIIVAMLRQLVLWMIIRQHLTPFIIALSLVPLLPSYCLDRLDTFFGNIHLKLIRPVQHKLSAYLGIWNGKGGKNFEGNDPNEEEIIASFHSAKQPPTKRKFQMQHYIFFTILFGSLLVDVPLTLKGTQSDLFPHWGIGHNYKSIIFTDGSLHINRNKTADPNKSTVLNYDLLISIPSFTTNDEVIDTWSKYPEGRERSIPIKVQSHPIIYDLGQLHTRYLYYQHYLLFSPLLQKLLAKSICKYHNYYKHLEEIQKRELQQKRGVLNPEDEQEKLNGVKHLQIVASLRNIGDTEWTSFVLWVHFCSDDTKTDDVPKVVE